MMNVRGHWFYTDNQIAKNILDAYCEGHSFLYRMFFGWRGTKGETARYYIFNIRACEYLRMLIEEVI